MTRKLFKNKVEEIKKKKHFLISQGLHQKIADIEKRAEKQGVSFPLNEHVEIAIQKLIRLAESQLDEMESPKTEETFLNKFSQNPKA